MRNAEADLALFDGLLDAHEVDATGAAGVPRNPGDDDSDKAAALFPFDRL